MAERLYSEALLALGAAVRSVRRQRGISQEELAYRSGLHRTYITDVERGARNVTVMSMAKLADALHIPMTEFFIPQITAGRTEQRDRLPGPASRGGRAIRILLVEDSLKDAELAMYALEKNGVANRVTHVQSGEEAIEMLHAGTADLPTRRSPVFPDLMLLDLTLPGMSGIDVLRKVRSAGPTRAVPVIILTASRSDQDLKTCLELGVSCYISKPVDFLEFSAAVSRLGLRWVLTEPRQRRAAERARADLADGAS